MLRDCSKLFSEHYGEWGSKGRRPYERIRLSPEKLKEYLNGMDGRAALATHGGELICYAFAVIFDYKDLGKVAWVTQLVTHRAYRKQSVATRLLRPIWTFSDYFAWGLVTANPFAVRALEGATTRKCDPVEIEAHAHDLARVGGTLIPYVHSKKLRINLSSSVIQTEFYVSHSTLPEMIRKAQTYGKWYLGDLDEGEEWFAFTFRAQKTRRTVRKGRIKQLEEQFADSEALLKRAYEGMSLDDNHSWAKSAEYEIDFAMKELALEVGQRVLDLGCGSGRHAIALGKRGVGVLGVDFIQKRVEDAQEVAGRQGLTSTVEFRSADARAFRAPVLFDAGLCLYDVVGSFPDESENRKILATLYANLRPGGRALLSVMNLSLTQSVAKNHFVLRLDASPLYALQPGSTMQDTGEIFNPDKFLLDTETQTIYRKEQFDLPGANLPAEIIVRDRRYSSLSISQLCNDVGFDVLFTRHVHAGDWVTDLAPTDPRAKEILVLLRKPNSDLGESSVTTRQQISQLI